MGCDINFKVFLFICLCRRLEYDYTVARGERCDRRPLKELILNGTARAERRAETVGMQLHKAFLEFIIELENCAHFRALSIMHSFVMCS